MIFKRMREQILDKAIRGQLVPQLQEEGVVDQIGEAPTEVPFEIPSSWRWVTLVKLTKEMADGPFGSNLKKEHYTDNKEVRIIQLSNIGENGWRNENLKYTTYKHADTISRSKVNAGDIVIAKMMPAGRAVIVPDLDNGYILSSDAVKAVVNSDICINTYLNYAINSTIFKDQVYSSVQGSTRIRTSLTKLKSYLVPVPPLKEQHRIVDKIESLFCEIDRAEKAYEELQSLANVLRGQILQKAIQGKLVPQLTEDGVVDPIGKAPEEVPFEIPNSWKWVKFEHTCNCLDSMRVPIKQKERENLNKQYPYYGATGVIDYVDKYIFDGSFLLIGEDGANLLSKSKDNAFIATGKFWVNNHAHIFDSNKVSELKYLAIVINAMNLNRYVTGSAQPKLTQKNLFSIPVPLPPLAEQKRIVAKVETLLEQIDLMTK